MPKRSKKSPAGKSVAAILLLTMCGAGALAAYVELNPKASHIAIHQSSLDISVDSKVDKSEPEAQADNGPTLLVPAVMSNDVKFGKTAPPAPEGVAPEVHLINQTLQSLQVDGARALGIDVKDRVAMVSFNPGIQKGYGTLEEGYLLKALSMALGQFPDIDKFQIVVEGKVVDSLGNIDLTTPVDVIRPNKD